LHRTGIVRDTRFLEHKTGIHHIEVARRLETIYSMIDNNGLKEKLSLITPRFASLAEIEMVHTAPYIEKIMDTAGEPLRYLDPDTVTSEKSCQAAFLAAGGVFEAVKSVLAGKLDNAFALIRPPGHHAERNRQMGFCIFNNIALAAEYALRQFNLSRVLIVDWDVHHPNGTQHIFEASKQVLLFSTHRFPFFPGTGAIEDIGVKDAQGYTINVPLSPQRTDRDFYEIFQKLLLPVALEFQPQLVLISAGFDTHFDDPVGGMRATHNCYALLTDLLMDIADTTCGGKIVIMLEGGYDLGAMRKSTKAVLETLLGSGAETIKEKMQKSSRETSPVTDIIQQVTQTVKPYWTCFQ